MNYFFNHPAVWLASLALFLMVIRGALWFILAEPEDWMSPEERIEVIQKYGSLAKKVKCLRRELRVIEVYISIGLITYFVFLILTFEQYEKFHAFYSVAYVGFYVFKKQQKIYLKNKKINNHLGEMAYLRRQLMCNSHFAEHMNESLNTMINEYDDYLKAEESIRKFLNKL